MPRILHIAVGAALVLRLAVVLPGQEFRSPQPAASTADSLGQPLPERENLSNFAAGPAETHEVRRQLEQLQAEVRGLQQQLDERQLDKRRQASAIHMPLQHPGPSETSHAPSRTTTQTAAYSTEPGKAPVPWKDTSGDLGGVRFPSTVITGLMQTDMGWVSQDSVNREVLGDVFDGWAFRRVRLTAKGEVAENVAYHLEFDFAQTQARFVDIFMDLRNALGVGHHVRIGRFRQPFGMSALTSIRHIPFLERASPFALGPFRQTGIMLYGNNGEEPTRTYAVSAFQFPSDNFGNVYADFSSWGTATRWTWLLMDRPEDRTLLHLGLDYSIGFAGRGELQIASLPELVLGQNPLFGPPGFGVLPFDGIPPFVITGVMPTDYVHVANLEAAGGVGNLYWQTEVRHSWVDRSDGGTHSFPGAYAVVRYVLTGERLPYERGAAVFGGIVPERPVRGACGSGGWGAWELAARGSWIDLNEAGLPGPGREMTNVTAGVNWYWNRHLRFQFNYIWSNLTNSPQGPSANRESEAHLVALRGQLDF